MAAAVLLLSGAAASRATPIAGVMGDLVSTADAVGWERVALRRCWQRGGVRHCRSYRGVQVYRYRNGNGDYYEHDANRLPYGTARWWDQMLRENRAGNSGGGGRN
jgi:hypothetical protein